MIQPLRPLSSIEVSSCWGMGFIAMDVVDIETDTFGTVGGSCGNVISILSWLGWSVRPIVRLGDDPAGHFIREELRGLGVDISYILEERGTRSPIVVQRFTIARDGTRTHRFSLTCPKCGRWLPRHRSVTVAQINSLICGDEFPNTFYFDRVSPASLRLAELMRGKGALVVFEPSSLHDESKFQRAIDTCHIFKYSHERLGHLPDLPLSASPALIVETHGEHGLRYRWGGVWSQLDAFTVNGVVDAAGAGDWCTANIIHRLGRYGAKSFLTSKTEMLRLVLQESQAIAAINCSFRGARGSMQAISLDELNQRLVILGQNAPSECNFEQVNDLVHQGLTLRYCEQCDISVSIGAKAVSCK